MEQQLLRWDRARRVDLNLDARLAPAFESWENVGEERAFEGAGLVTSYPEPALEVFEVSDLDVARDEVADVGEEDGRRAAVFGREGVAVGSEGGGVPT